MSPGELKVRLNDGREMPAIALGTWQSKAGEVERAVSYAIKEAGYCHIDCAWVYGNEKEVGDGIRASGIPREDLWITGKVWGTYHSRVEESLNETLEKLGVDYLDLYLIHWPVPMNPQGNHPAFPTLPDGKRDVDHNWKLADTWKQMEALQKAGKVKSIGVSNFSESKLQEILPSAEVIPAVNQLELHPYNPQHELAAYLRSKGILPHAYSPLGSTNSPLLKDETIVRIAQKHGITTADVLLGWHLFKGTPLVAKSVTPERISANFTGPVAASQLLDQTDLADIDRLAAEGKQRRFITPPWPVELGFKDWQNPA